MRSVEQERYRLRGASYEIVALNGASMSTLRPAGMPTELRHFFVAHVAHLDRWSRLAHVAPMAVVAPKTFAVAALVANENVGLNVRTYHVDLASPLIRKLGSFRAFVKRSFLLMARWPQ
jgi:hypothetical protein